MSDIIQTLRSEVYSGSVASGDNSTIKCLPI